MTSTAESTSVSEPPATPQAVSTPETPVHEIERRLADQAPLWPVAHAAGLQNQRAIWADAQIKRRMDRLVQARQLGVEESLLGNEEMPGNINIKGDETHYHYPQPAAPTIPTAITTMATTAKKTIWPVMVAALLSGGLGAAAPLAYWWLNKPQPQPQVTLPDYQLRLEVKDKP